MNGTQSLSSLMKLMRRTSQSAEAMNDLKITQVIKTKTTLMEQNLGKEPINYPD